MPASFSPSYRRKPASSDSGAWDNLDPGFCQGDGEKEKTYLLSPSPPGGEGRVRGALAGDNEFVMKPLT